MRLVTFAAATLMLAAPGVALADTILYNQAYSKTTAYYSGTGFKAADDFTLNSTGTINQVSFYGGYFSSTPSSDPFTINFYSNNAGSPGSLLSTSSGTATSVDAGFKVLGIEIYQFTTSVPSFTAIGGTSYFFQMVSSTYQNYAWLTGTGGNGTHFENASAFGNPSYTDVNDQAFTLTNVSAATPEPSSLALLGTGVIGVAGFARRRFINA